MSESGDCDLWLFRDYIEAHLKLDGFRHDSTSTPMTSIVALGKLKLPKSQGELAHAVRTYLQYFHKQKPGYDYWLQYLTPFEAQARALLIELLTASTSLRFEVPLTDDQLREVLKYSVSASWLVYTALLEQYSSSDGPTDISDVPF